MTEETKIKDLIPEGFEFDEKSLTLGEIIIKFKKKEKSPKELANKLGFKTGDRCWTKDKDYAGIITSFTKPYWANVVQCKYANEINLIDGYFINKVAIHCITKEDFDFINGLMKATTYDWEYCKAEKGCYLPINHNTDAPDFNYITNEKWLINNNWLILTIDEYMQSQEIKPFFVTLEEKNNEIIKIQRLTDNEIFMVGLWGNNWSISDINFWKLADINEVKKLLKEECQKRFSDKIGCKINQKSAYGENGGIHKLISNNIVVAVDLYNHINVSIGEIGVFNTKLGIWAEVIEESNNIIVEIEIPKGYNLSSKNEILDLNDEFKLFIIKLIKNG